MDKYTATEQAYKNGYKTGYQKARSEVAKEIFTEIELFLNTAIEGWRKERKVTYNNRQIEMIDFRNDAYKYCLYEIAELKKKYIEDKQDEN